MNIQNLKENILVKKALPILKILDFRQYFFSYLFIINPFFITLFVFIDIDKLMHEFSLIYAITFFLVGIYLVTTPLFLIAEIFIRALLKKFFPNNQILLNLESIPKKMNLFGSIIFYILFALSTCFMCVGFYYVLFPLWFKTLF